MGNYEAALEKAGRLLADGQVQECVMLCGTAFEQGLRDIMSRLYSSLDREDREALTMAEKELTGGKSYQNFTLGEFTGLLRAGPLKKFMKRIARSDMRKCQRIDWNEVKEWRNAAAHGKEHLGLDFSDAEQMLIWLKVFLYDCELIRQTDETAELVPPTLSSKCPDCGQALQPGWKYCPYCGISRINTCSTCKRGPLEPDWTICPYCEELIVRRGAWRSDAETKARATYRTMCKGAYLDGVVSPLERALLNEKRLELGLTSEEAEDIERQIAPKSILAYYHAVEAALIDGEISTMERDYLSRKAVELSVDEWTAEEIENSVKAVCDSMAWSQRIMPAQAGN